jgi:hypothetical protein
MAAVSFPENFYTLRKVEPIFGTIFNPRTPDQTLAKLREEVELAKGLCPPFRR